MRDIMGMMKKMQDMQSRMQEMQDNLAAMEVTGQSGGGMVSVVMSGRMELKSLRIDPALMKPDEAEIVEDLVIAAIADAKGKAEAAIQEKMAELTGGLPLPPGLKLW
ncbi:MAG: YbaB/EbfC family nucleoid-associated protein [Hyphomicrobiaceae bacterium]